MWYWWIDYRAWWSEHFVSWKLIQSTPRGTLLVSPQFTFHFLFLCVCKNLVCTIVEHAERENSFWLSNTHVFCAKHFSHLDLKSRLRFSSMFFVNKWFLIWFGWKRLTKLSRFAKFSNNNWQIIVKSFCFKILQSFWFESFFKLEVKDSSELLNRKLFQVEATETCDF